MRNYMITRNGNANDIFNAFEGLFGGEYREETMKANITESENGYDFALAMPGFNKEEISVTLDGGYLTVSGKKEQTEEKGKYLRREIAQSVSRSFYVGEGVKGENVKAKYENGVLNLFVPKEEPEETVHKILVD